MSGPSRVTPAQAKSVVDQYWPVHEQALVGRDVATLRRLETGAMADYEPNAVSCGCLTVTSVRPLLDTRIFLPRQSTYPVHFAVEAETQYEGQYWIELLVFTKAAPGKPWLASEDSGFGPPAGVAPSMGRPTVDAAGYVQPPTAAQHARAQLAAAQLATLWQRAKDSGVVPATPAFQLSGQTAHRFERLAAFPTAGPQANGLYGRYRFFVGHDPLVEFADGPADLACQPIREVVVYTAPGGRAVLQDQSQRNWGPSLDPGRYESVVSRDAWQTCFLIPDNPNQPISVLNQDVGGALVTAR